MTDINHGIRMEPSYDANNTTAIKSGKSLFSAPQNRRSSTVKALSHRSHQSDQGGGGNGIDGSTRGNVSTELTSASLEANVAVADRKTPLKSSNRSIKSVQDVLGQLPILLVDDAVSIIKITKRAIQNECANISFMEAKNGEEAFERVVEAVTSFELIITDIQMPICDGFEFTRRVRKMERDQGLAPKMIIGISANDQQKIAEEAKECGMVRSYHDISCLIMPNHNSASNDTTLWQS